jgi:hypothetical protein
MIGFASRLKKGLALAALGIMTVAGGSTVASTTAKADDDRHERYTRVDHRYDRWDDRHDRWDRRRWRDEREWREYQRWKERQWRRYYRQQYYVPPPPPPVYYYRGEPESYLSFGFNFR